MMILLLSASGAGEQPLLPAQPRLCLLCQQNAETVPKPAVAGKE